MVKETVQSLKAENDKLKEKVDTVFGELKQLKESLKQQHPGSGGAKVQVTGHRSAHRSQATGQVTGQTTGHRSGHRSDHTSHTKTHTKLFLIDILLYKNRTSQGTSIIFFLF